MQRLEGRFVYSASDLNDYLECKRLTELEALVARKRLLRPDSQDERAELLRRKGEEHEQRHLDALIERYPGEVVEFDRAQPGVEQYRQAEARRSKRCATERASFTRRPSSTAEFIGHADFLRRVETPSRLGRLWVRSRRHEARAGTQAPYYLVQLCNYSEHLERLQGVLAGVWARRFRQRRRAAL
jgi:predicted RecB family nuclease